MTINFFYCNKEYYFKNILLSKIETRIKQIKNFLKRTQLLIKENE